MPSSNNVETMFVQHYSEKVPTGVGMWQLATNWQLCRKTSNLVTIQVGNDAASRPTRWRFKLARCRKRDQVWSHTATRSSIIPQKCGSGNDATLIKINSAMMLQVVLRDDGSSRLWCRKLSYKTTIEVGNDAAIGSMRWRLKSAMMPQVVQRAYNSSWQWCCNVSYKTTIQVGNDATVKLAWCHNQREKFGRILLPEQYNTTGVWKWQWCHYKDQSRTAMTPQVVYTLKWSNLPLGLLTILFLTLLHKEKPQVARIFRHLSLHTSTTRTRSRPWIIPSV
jgi:hypothetical protein